MSGEENDNEYDHTLSSIDNVAFLLRDQGKLCEAEQFWQEAPDGVSTPTAVGSLGGIAQLLESGSLK